MDQIKTARPDNPAVKRALKRVCPLCDAPAGQRCVVSAGPMEGRPLTNRIVHYARTEMRR